MAATFTLTGNLNDVVDDVLPYPTSVDAFLVANIPAGDAIIDLTTNKHHLGTHRIDVDKTSGAFTVPGVLDTDATDLNVAAGTLRFQVEVTYRNGAGHRQPYTSGWFEMTANANLATLARDASPMAVQSASQYALEAKGYRDEAQTAIAGAGAAAAVEADRAEAAADYVEGVITTDLGTTDGQTKALIVTPTSQTALALAATLDAALVDEVTPSVAGTVTALAANAPTLLYMDSLGRLLRNNGNVLERSADNGTTWSTLHTFNRPPIGVRQLDNGELLVGTGDNFPTNTIKAALWISSGYAGTPTFTKKLDASDYQQTISLAWGFGGGGQVYAVSEYDSKAPGSRSANQRAWITTDSGATWTQIYDHGNGSLSTRHIHGVAADPYRPGTVWLTLGDYTGDATGDRRIRVSRNNGATWADVTTIHQPTPIMCFPDCVAFGTDNAPNGVLVIPNPDDAPAAMRVELAYRISNFTNTVGFPLLSHVAERPFRANTSSGYLTLLPYSTADAGLSGLVLGSYDGRVWFEVWRDTRTYAANKGAFTAVGPTKDGRVLIQGQDGSAGGRFSDEIGLSPTPGVAGATARVGKALARRMPKRSVVVYSIAGGQTVSWTLQPVTLNTVTPTYSEDVSALFTRASDGSGVIVNRGVYVDIQADSGAPAGGNWYTAITVDGTVYAFTEAGSRIDYRTYVPAGSKIAVQVNPQSGATGPLRGVQALSLEAWETHTA